MQHHELKKFQQKLLLSSNVASGNYNAKHLIWEFWLFTSRGRLVCQAKHLSTGQPTYWSLDLIKIPDLMDLRVTGYLQKPISNIQYSIIWTEKSSGKLDENLQYNLPLKAPEEVAQAVE